MRGIKRHLKDEIRGQRQNKQNPYIIRNLSAIANANANATNAASRRQSKLHSKMQ